MTEAYLRDGEAIYRRSFAIIRAEADLAHFSAEEAEVAVRMIHACGLVEAAERIVFGHGLVAAARAALAQGAPILCDAEMVAHGIIRARLPAGNAVICTLNDPGVPALAAKLGTTRSAAALDLWGDRLGGAVVAIGNAPTALFRLLELVARGRAASGRHSRHPGRFCRRRRIQGSARGKPAPHPVPGGARPYRRQRHDGRRRQRAGEARTMNAAAKLIGIGVGPGDPELLTLKALRALREADVVAHFAKAGKPSRARAIAAGHFNPGATELPLCFPVTTEIPKNAPAYCGKLGAFYDGCAAAVAKHLDDAPLGRRDLRRRPAVLRLLHASSRATRPALSDRGDRRRHRHVRLLVGDGLAHGAGRRCVHRPSRHAAGSRTRAPPRRCRCRRGDEAWPQSRQGAPRPRLCRAASRALYVERGTMTGAVAMRLADKADDEAPYFALVLVPGWERR